jgi:hypothetical protein
MLRNVGDVFNTMRQATKILEDDENSDVLRHRQLMQHVTLLQSDSPQATDAAICQCIATRMEMTTIDKVGIAFTLLVLEFAKDVT